jgi:hypothetical protein
MSEQSVDISGIKIPDLTGVELKSGARAMLNQPHPPTAQEQAEMDRSHALIVEYTKYDWVGPAALCLFLLFAFCVAAKLLRRLCQAAKEPGRTAVVFSLFLGIRGARKVSGAAKGLWTEAKAADKKVAEIERSAE